MTSTDLADATTRRHQARALDLIERHWCALARGGRLPRRAEIDPRGIEDALEYAFLVERIAPGHARLRVAGGHLTALAGMDVAGMPLSVFLAPAARQNFAALLRGVFDDPARLSLPLAAPGRFGQPELQGRMVLFPLADERGAATRALGGLALAGRIGRAPRRVLPLEPDLRPLDRASGAVTPLPADRPSLRLVVDNG